MSSLVRAEPLAVARPRRPHPLVYFSRLAAVALVSLLIAYAAIGVRVAESFSRAQRQPLGSPTAFAPTYEDVAFRASDGLTLRGWFFPGTKERAVILLHGRHGNRSNEAKEKIARFLLAAGYSVLVFDFRGHGESEGDRFSLGHHERKDVAAAIDHLVGRGFRADRVALLGLSMGAGTAVQAVALRPGIGPVVVDSGYTSGRAVVDEAGPRVTGLPTFFNPGILLAAKLFFGLDADAVDPLAVVRAHAERPFLFIHCERDSTLGVHHAKALFAASRASELWVAPDCEHVQAFGKYPAEYERRVLAFLDARMR